MARTWPKPKLLIISFPANPTTQTVDLAFMERIVEFAREHHLMVVHDFAYAEICFDGYKPPSILQVPGARDVAIEFVSLSKSHSMAGWRVGFAAGNREMIHALTRIKSYLDYGIPTPIQVGGIVALRGPQGLRHRERRRVQGAPRRPDRRTLAGRRGAVEDREAAGDHVRLGAHPGNRSARWVRSSSPSGSWRRPRSRWHPASASARAEKATVRFALVENSHRIRQAVRGIRRFLRSAAGIQAGG